MVILPAKTASVVISKQLTSPPHTPKIHPHTLIISYCSYIALIFKECDMEDGHAWNKILGILVLCFMHKSNMFDECIMPPTYSIFLSQTNSLSLPVCSSVSLPLSHSSLFLCWDQKVQTQSAVGEGCEGNLYYRPTIVISVQIFQAGLRKSKSLRSGIFITSPALQPYAHLQTTAASSFGGLSPVSRWSQEKTPISPGFYLFVGWKHHRLGHCKSAASSRCSAHVVRKG